MPRQWSWLKIELGLYMCHPDARDQPSGRVLGHRGALDWVPSWGLSLFPRKACHNLTGSSFHPNPDLEEKVESFGCPW